MSTSNVKEVVREKYGQAALRVTSGAGNCCGAGRASALEAFCDPITSNLYDPAQKGELPETAIKASLGSGPRRRGAGQRGGRQVFQCLCSSEQARNVLLRARLLLLKMVSLI